MLNWFKEKHYEKQYETVRHVWRYCSTAHRGAALAKASLLCGQLSCKRPPLVQDKLVADWRWLLTGKINKIILMRIDCSVIKKGITLSAKIGQMVRHVQQLSEKVLECTCQCVSWKSSDWNLNRTKPTSSLYVNSYVSSVWLTLLKTEVLSLLC